MGRSGHERFTEPTLAAQRRYEALRAYWVEERSAGEIAERFGYSKGSVQTLISRYRQADLAELFARSRPGPKRQPKKDAARERVLVLRRERHGIEEIVAELARAGTPLSRTAVWEILREEGLSRMPRPAFPPKTGPEPGRLAAEKVRVLGEGEWPETGRLQTQHAGLFLLIGDLIALDLPGLVDAAGWPSTSQLDALHSVLALMALKLSGRRRRSHVANVVHDPALGLFCSLNALPKTWHLKTYSYRTTRAQQLAFFEALQPRLREAGLRGEQGLNLDFHAIMSYGQETILEKHYVPRRSQRTRSVLSFIAQDGAEHTIIYANAELTARAQSGEVIEFCRFYEKTHGELPKLLVFDGKLTTHEHLAELDEIGVGFITLRQRSPKLIGMLGSSPRQRLDQDPARPCRQAQDRQLPRAAGHDRGQSFPPARRPGPRPRPADADPHQPPGNDAQAADRALRQALGDREPARRTDPRLPPGLPLLPGAARCGLRHRAHRPGRHRLPALRAWPARRLPPPEPRHAPRPADRRDRRAALQPRPR